MKTTKKMKHVKIITLFIITLLLSLNLKAQIQLSPDDAIAKGFYKLAIDTIPSTPVGSPGTSKTWDFSGSKKHISSNVVIAPYTDNGMGLDANLVEIEDGDSTSYFKKTSSNLKVVLPDAELGHIRLSILDFPFGYSSVTTDSSSSFFLMTGDELGFPLFDSVKLIFSVKFTSIGDAWGTLKTPTANYNALRVQTEVFSKIVAEGKIGSGPYISIPGFEETNSSIEYKWFAKGKGFPVASFDQDDNRFSWYESGTLSGKNVEVEKKKEVIATNPVGDNFVIKNTGNDNCTVKITDISGKIILSTPLNKGEELTTDASLLPQGVYIMNVNYIQSSKSYNTKLIK